MGAIAAFVPPLTTQPLIPNQLRLFDFSERWQSSKAAALVGGSSLGGRDQILVTRVGDALQEPIWTSGLGVNRGFHGGLNAVYAAACARHRGLPEACAEADKAWRRMLAINWPAGIATDYRKGCCVKPGETWTADPTTRL